MFDGSSIAGWKAINESDMKLMPDPSTAAIDPFFAQTTLSIVCDVLEPLTDEPYDRDPRSIAKKAEAYLKSTKIGDTVFFGPEAEFFVFDDVRYSAHALQHRLQASTTSSCRSTPTPNTRWAISATASAPRAAISRCRRSTRLQDMRSEMLGAMASMGIKVEKHHHEVASAQHELGMKFDTLVTMADHLQIYKYCIHNVANAYGKTATFMPKPIYGDNGSGMHVHQSIWKDGKPLFAGKHYADLSRGVPLLHRRHHQARQGAERLHQPADQLLQAAGAGLRGAGAARLFGAQPLGVLPHPGHRRTRRPSASRCASPIRAPTPISPSPRC